MTDAPLSESERVQAFVIAALLAQGRIVQSLNLAGLVVTLALAAGLAILHRLDPIAAALLASAVLAAIAGSVMALRIGFDAGLFAGLARGEFGLVAMDRALVVVVRLSPLKTGRPLAVRIAGALRLMRVQAWLMALQGAALVSVLALLMIRT